MRDLNRTLLERQQLLERTSRPAVAMVEHLVGLQAQENLSPYLSLSARLEGFDPLELSASLERGEVVRLLAMRGTLHLLSAHDALALRGWVQPALDGQSAASVVSRPAGGVPLPAFVAAVGEVLDDGPLPVQQLGERLAQRFPGVPAEALAHLARERVPLVQLPPRGLWGRFGGVVYQTLDRHLGRPANRVDVREVVRRYLRAFGPASPADMTTWSRVTRLRPVFAAMREELVEVPCEDGRTRWDVPDAPYAAGDRHAPARLLGTYDNLWLSHADRERVAPPAVRARWMGSNGGVASTVFVDGYLAGLWRRRAGRVEVELLVPLTRAQREELAEEVARVQALLG